MNNSITISARHVITAQVWLWLSRCSVLHNLETFSNAVRAFTVLECTLEVRHNLHASPDSFSERASDALYYLHDVLYHLHVLTT